MKKLLVVLAGVLSLVLVSTVHAADLKYGMKNNDDVKQMQQFLKDQGKYTGDVTGNFYSVTLAAVKKFQKTNGLKVTGVWNQVAQDKMNELAVTTDVSPTPVADTSPSIPVGWIANGDGTFSPPPTVLNYPQAVASAWTPPAQVVYGTSPTTNVPSATQPVVNPTPTVVADTTPPKAIVEQYSMIQMMPPFTQRISGGSSMVIFGKSKLPYGSQENYCISCIAIVTDEPTTLHLRYLDSFKDSDTFDQKQEYADKIKTLDDPLNNVHIIMLKNISAGWPNLIYYKYSIKDSSGNEFNKNSWVSTGYDPKFDESSTMIDSIKTTY